MKNSKLSNYALIFLLIFLFSCMTEEKKPNIVFILADDLSYRDLSCYGQEVYKTPHLDALANSGMRFTQAYTAAPECAPARGCLLTGTHTGHGPIRINGSALGQHPLADSDITIAEVLKEAGYNTAFLGKWGIGNPGSEGVPYKQGFDLAFGYYSQIRAHTYYPDYLMHNESKVMYPENKGFDMLKRYNIGRTMHDSTFNTYNENGKIFIEELEDPYGGSYSENEIEKKALEFVSANTENPFFLYYATQLPHGPVIVDDFSKMQDLTDIPQPNREWAAMVIKLDDFVGTLIKELKRQKLYENTIIFFASDNGYAHWGYFGRKGYPEWEDDPWFKNKGPFTGGKFSAFEGGCRIPFFVSWEGKIQAAVSSEPVWLPDFFPTAAGLAGIDVEHKIDGTDLWPLLSGEAEKFKTHPYLYFSKNREQAVRKGPWKAYRESPEKEINLYLIEEDSYGARNLAEYYPTVVKQMEDIMDNSFTPHEWYWTPDETAEEYQKKVKKAKEEGLIIPFHRPNGLERLPWEGEKLR